jgi:hypothetical protein
MRQSAFQIGSWLPIQRTEQCIFETVDMPKPCKICTQLKEALLSAHDPDSPSILLGLSEAGKRNRALQKQELVLKSETVFEKHMKSCLNRAKGSLAEH